MTAVLVLGCLLLAVPASGAFRCLAWPVPEVLPQRRRLPSFGRSVANPVVCHPVKADTRIRDVLRLQPRVLRPDKHRER
jgi:hypothetical protein